MSALDFQDREPELDPAHRPRNQLFSGNGAFYERLQGQGRKGVIERYGWIAVPVAIVAVIGVVAVTSTPHQSASDVGGPPPSLSTAQVSTPAPARTTPASGVNEALATSDAASTPGQSTNPAKSPSAAPAPVKVARKTAAPSDALSPRPAAATPAERSAATPEAAPAPAPTVQAPVAAPTPAPTVTQDAAPQPAAPAASPPSSDNSASQAQPAQ